MLNLYGNPLVKGLTTNPTLMRKAGIQDYESFARDILKEILDTVKMFAQDAEKAGFKL